MRRSIEGDILAFRAQVWPPSMGSVCRERQPREKRLRSLGTRRDFSVRDWLPTKDGPASCNRPRSRKKIPVSGPTQLCEPCRVSSLVTDFAQERAQDAPTGVSVENLTEQLLDYRHRLSPRSEATDRAIGGAMFATCRCQSRSRTTSVRQRVGRAKRSRREILGGARLREGRCPIRRGTVERFATSKRRRQRRSAWTNIAADLQVERTRSRASASRRRGGICGALQRCGGESAAFSGR